MSWNDFSDADEQQGVDVIPHRTPVKVITKIRPGGADFDGCPPGLATRSDNTGAVYLDCEFTVMGGKYNKRKVWSLIGLHSPKGPTWANMGRTMIRAMLESARGVKASDTSEEAMKARRIKDLSELNGLEFCALAEVQKADPDTDYDDKNVIQKVIGVEHKDYQALMSGSANVAPMTKAAPKTEAPADDLPDWARA